MPGGSLFRRRSRDAAPADPAVLQRRLDAAAELIGAARLVLLLDDDEHGQVTIAAATAADKPDPAGPSLSAPVTRAGVQVGIVHAMRDKGAAEFADADRWLLEALAAQLSTDQPRFFKRVDTDTR
jgi:GAF domain-containing protein